MTADIYFISGIDTGIGKTYTTGYLAKLWREQGQNVITQKLVQTGNVGFSEDIQQHRDIMGIAEFPEDIEKFTAQLDFDVLSANYNNTPDYSGCECRFVGADGVAQWYEIRVYYWFGRSRVLITVRNVNDAHDYLDEEYEKMLCRSAGLCKRM